MKAFLPIMMILAASILPLGSAAQTFGTSAPRPGVTISTNPYGTSVGVSSPYLNIVYTSNGFYDCYGHHHHVSHKHGKHQSYCKQCEKEYQHYYKQAHKQPKHKHDNGNHNGWYKH